jgi:hypothetical protein
MTQILAWNSGTASASTDLDLYLERARLKNQHFHEVDIYVPTLDHIGSIIT